MSYYIYKQIKMNKDKSFDTVVASSNLFDMNNNYIFENYHMDYYCRYNNLSNEQVKIMFIIQSIYNGDKFYPTAWKNLQNRVHECIMDNINNVYKVVYTGDIDKVKYHLNNIIVYLQKTEKYIKKYLVQINGSWVSKKTSKRVLTTPFKSEAKVFKDTIEHLKFKFEGYSQYNVQFVEQ